MTIGRIEIDFAIRDEDDLHTLLDGVGELVLPFLDPHDHLGNCTRWVQIGIYEDVDDEYELGFEKDDVLEIEGALVKALDLLDDEWRGNSQWN